MITRLSDIIDTGSQAELLAFFITATPRSFSVLELSRRLKINPSEVKISATDLEKQNLLKTFSKNRTTFYLLNQRHAMIPQLRDSFRKEHKQWPDELASSIKKLGTLSGIFLSGIFVGRPELVVDLLLVGNVSDTQLAKFLKTTSKQFGGELNYSIMSPEEFVMRRDTFDRFIKDIFDYPHIVLLDRSNAPLSHSTSVLKAQSKPVVAKSAPAKPVAKKTIAKKPVAKKPVVKKPAVKKPAPAKPIAKKLPVQKAKLSKPPVKKAKPVKKSKSTKSAKQVKAKHSPKKTPIKKASNKKRATKKRSIKKRI